MGFLTASAYWAFAVMKGKNPLTPLIYYHSNKK